MLNHRLVKESSYKKFYKTFIVLFNLLNSLFTVISAFALSSIVNGVFIEKHFIFELEYYLLLFIINAFLKGLFNFLLELYIENSAEEIKENIKAESFKKILSGNPYKVRKEKLGEVINTLTDGIEMITPYYSQYIPQVLAAVIIPGVVFIASMFIDKPSALIMIITYPIIPMFMILIGYKSKMLNEKQWKKLSVLSSHFVDMLQGLSNLKVFGRSKIQEEKVFNISESYRKATMEVLRVSFSSALVLELFSTLSTALIAVNLGLRLVYNKIDFFSAFFILILAPDFYLPVRNLGLRFHASLNGKVAIEKVDDIVDKLKYETQEEALEGIKESSYEIEVRNLNFSYENKKALNNLSFKVKRGEKLAFVGESGSGKSTLINILSGFIKPEEGTVFINGQDINHINREEFMKGIALVPQFPHIFNKSIEDNIMLGEDKIQLEEFLDICKRVKIDEMQEKFKSGYGTIVGEGERVMLSGGESQKIAIARALIKRAKLLILDEPSSALDNQNETLLTEIVKEYLKDSTILIAAHRLNTIMAVDRILVFHEGNLVEEGTNEELLLKQGRYYEILKALEV